MEEIDTATVTPASPAGKHVPGVSDGRGGKVISEEEFSRRFAGAKKAADKERAEIAAKAAALETELEQHRAEKEQAKQAELEAAGKFGEIKKAWATEKDGLLAQIKTLEKEVEHLQGYRKTRIESDTATVKARVEALPEELQATIDPMLITNPDNHGALLKLLPMLESAAAAKCAAAGGVNGGPLRPAPMKTEAGPTDWAEKSLSWMTGGQTRRPL